MILCDAQMMVIRTKGLGMGVSADALLVGVNFRDLEA